MTKRMRDAVKAMDEAIIEKCGRWRGLLFDLSEEEVAIGLQAAMEVLYPRGES